MASASRSYAELLLTVFLRELPEQEELRLRADIEGDSEQFNDLIFLGGAYTGLDPTDLKRHPSRKLLVDLLLEDSACSRYPEANDYLRRHLTVCPHCQETINKLQRLSPEELLRLQSIKTGYALDALKRASRKRLKAVLKDWHASLQKMLADLESPHEPSGESDR